MKSLIGRNGVIRTHDPLHPMQVRYQAALRPDVRIEQEPARKEGCIIKQNRIFAKQNMRFYKCTRRFRLGLLAVVVPVEFAL